MDARGFFLQHGRSFSQAVLLSLFQQLSCDLVPPAYMLPSLSDLDNITIKLTWLTEVAVVLDPRDSIVAPQLAPIVDVLIRNLNALIGVLSSDPGQRNVALASTARVLVHIAQGLYAQVAVPSL